MIFTFPTSKTNEGFFLIEDSYFRHNRDHKENSSIAQPSFPKNIEAQEEIFHVEIDTWRFDRSVLWPLDGLQIDSFLHHFPQRAAMSKMYKFKKNVHRNVALSCTVIGQKLSHNQLNQSNAKLDLLRAFSTTVGSFRCCFCCRFFFLRSYGLHLIIYDTGWHRQTFAVSRLHWTPETIKYTLYRLKLHERPINKGG